MLFNTFQFFVFFVVVFCGFFLLPVRWRNIFLLLASYYFYMCWSRKYIFIILAITAIDFAAGILIEQARTPRARKYSLAMSVLCNFGLLFVVKYADFFNRGANAALAWLGAPAHIPLFNLILPVGISFHTFQAVSYTIEVYRGRAPAERDFLRYALYIAIFPQMVAGPIERPYNLLPQLDPRKKLTYDRFRSGLQMAIWGLFKKMVVADRLAPVVAQVYGQPANYSGPVLALASWFFAAQIYCDFSGYSDIAIGVARMMGYDLMINFRQPYYAKSIGEFWHRWHISLSTWFRDYLYVPLGGNRVPPARLYGNLLLVFLVSGLWHGANWTFLAWGLLHGIYLVSSLITRSLRARFAAAAGLVGHPAIHAGSQTVTTFALVTLGWIFFRAASLRDAGIVLRRLFVLQGFHVTDLFTLGLPRFEMALAVALIVILMAVEGLIVYTPRVVMEWWRKPRIRAACYYACVFGIVFFGVFGSLRFIYFQF